MIIVTIVLAILVVVFGLVLLLKRSTGSTDTSSALLLKQDLSQLSDDIIKLKDGLQTQMTERFDKNQDMMRDSIQKQFASSNKIIADVTERLTKLDETNKRVVYFAKS
jgi:hypothetical protein